MRLLKILAIAGIGAIALTACGKKDEPMKTYDLSAEANSKYLADNKAKDGVKTLPDGLQYRVIKSGNGKGVTSGADTVSVYYKGWLINGKVFDQTQPDQPASFPAGRLIPGWVEALRMMHEGDEWQIVIPAELGYGASGAGDAIPPNQTLVFDMTLLTVTPEAAPQQ